MHFTHSHQATDTYQPMTITSGKMGGGFNFKVVRHTDGSQRSFKVLK